MRPICVGGSGREQMGGTLFTRVDAVKLGENSSRASRVVVTYCIYGFRITI